MTSLSTTIQSSQSQLKYSINSIRKKSTHIPPFLFRSFIIYHFIYKKKPSLRRNAYSDTIFDCFPTKKSFKVFLRLFFLMCSGVTRTSISSLSSYWISLPVTFQLREVFSNCCDTSIVACEYSRVTYFKALKNFAE